MFDFAANTQVQNIEVVPEEFRSLYVETQGETEDEKFFKLDDSDPKTKSSVSAIVGLNTALKAARAEAKAHKSKAVDLTALKELAGAQGDGVEEISAALRGKIEELEGQLASGKDAGINLEKIKSDLAAAHKVEIESREREKTALSGQLYELLVEQEAVKAMGDSAINPSLLMPFVKQQLKTVIEDGRFKVVVVDAAGDRRYSGVTGNELSVKELVDEMKAKDDFRPLFKSEAKKGSGTPTERVSSNFRRVETTELTPRQKIQSGLNGFRR